MAKIKFNPEVNPLNKEHYGYTFQRNRYGFSMFPASKSGRKRYLLQFEKMQYMQKAIRNWRDMSSASKTAWNDFAATYPVPSEKDPGVFLSGYQLFLKRHFYRFLHEGINFEFMEFPIMEALPVPDFSIQIKDGGWCADLTEEYIRNFGLLPEPGQFIICRILPMAVNSGQFFEPLIATLEVQEIYMDGLICSFIFSPIPKDIVFSIYVSKPVWESVQYPGTKFRYMGCFKPTTFLQLTDTPASYENEAGKVVAVKDDETGLEFIEPAGCVVCPPVPSPADAGKVIIVNPAGDGYELAEGGGGEFNCDDLLDCSIIQDILNQLENISNTIIENDNTSIPPIKFGLLYNAFVIYDPRGIATDNWRVPSIIDMDSLIATVGGQSIAALHLKDSDLKYWSPNYEGLNDFKFNWRGSALRYDNGYFTSLLASAYFWLSDYSPTAASQVSCSSADHITKSYLNSLKAIGCSIRLCRENNSMPNQTSGLYKGNNNRIYRTIKIGNLEWLADNLAETLFCDGSPIPEVTNRTEWRFLTTPALCAHENNWSNV